MADESEDLPGEDDAVERRRESEEQFRRSEDPTEHDHYPWCDSRPRSLDPLRSSLRGKHHHGTQDGGDEEKPGSCSCAEKREGGMDALSIRKRRCDVVPERPVLDAEEAAEERREYSGGDEWRSKRDVEDGGTDGAERCWEVSTEAEGVREGREVQEQQRQGGCDG
jgi:hypothetical protein